MKKPLKQLPVRSVVVIGLAVGAFWTAFELGVSPVEAVLIAPFLVLFIVCALGLAALSFGIAIVLSLILVLAVAKEVGNLIEWCGLAYWQIMTFLMIVAVGLVAGVLPSWLWVLPAAAGIYGLYRLFSRQAVGAETGA